MESWANRAGIIWCAEPEVTAARVLWKDHQEAEPLPDAVGAAGEQPEPQAPDRPENRPPTLVLPLEIGSRVLAEIQLWCDHSQPLLVERLKTTPVLAAWEAWASLVAEQTVLERRLRAIVTAVRQQGDDDEARTRDHKLQALAEFAAGAGHELNNPLAVVVGRAQLLLGRSQDAETSRSLRIILSQAQRTHRILRDLMFVARPPSLLPRSCRPSEVLRACLASFREECEARGVRLESDLEQTETPTWADPDALGHLAETLVRNAIQTTPLGGKVQVRSRFQGNDLRWWICDSGKGIGPAEGAHLFDPFYCGRQAGRGLGLGLPRAARIVALAGGSLHWSSPIGQGTTFQVRLPLVSPPEMVGTATTQDRSALAQRDPSAKNLGTLCTRNHHVRNRVAVGAKVGYVERFRVIPMMTLETAAMTTPDTASGTRDQAQHLAQGRRVPCRPRPDAAGTQAIETDLDMSSQTGKQCTPVVTLSSLHGSQPVL